MGQQFLYMKENVNWYFAVVVWSVDICHYFGELIVIHSQFHSVSWSTDLNNCNRIWFAIDKWLNILNSCWPTFIHDNYGPYTIEVEVMRLDDGHGLSKGCGPWSGAIPFDLSRLQSYKCIHLINVSIWSLFIVLILPSYIQQLN